MGIQRLLHHCLLSKPLILHLPGRVRLNGGDEDLEVGSVRTKMKKQRKREKKKKKERRGGKKRKRKKKPSKEGAERGKKSTIQSIRQIKRADLLPTFYIHPFRLLSNKIIKNKINIFLFLFLFLFLSSLVFKYYFSIIIYLLLFFNNILIIKIFFSSFSKLVTIHS